MMEVVMGAGAVTGASGFVWQHEAASDVPRMNGTENLAGKSCPVRA